MKRRAILIVLITSLLVFQLPGQAVVKNGALSVKGSSLVNEKGEIIMLQGVSYGWHNWWPRFYNEETVSWFSSDWNCTVVRAAIGISAERGYFEKPDFALEKLENVINGAIKSGIYVIIDWHAHEIYTKEAVDFFTSMAKKYGDYPNVIYEIFNEPVRQSWEEVKAYSIEVIEAIRKYDPDNIILVGSPHWDQDVHIVADDPIVGYQNLMYTLHFYAATHKQDLIDRGNYAVSKGIPLFVSESAGMSSNGDGPIDYVSWQKWIDWMKKNKISWITWSVADKDETCSMLKKEASSKGGWNETVLKESGIKTRAYYINNQPNIN